jgi:hypothetical protein
VSQLPDEDQEITYLMAVTPELLRQLSQAAALRFRVGPDRSLRVEVVEAPPKEEP